MRFTSIAQALHLVRIPLILAAVTAGVARGDVIETISGSVIRGHVIASDGGAIRIETDFADTIAIKQEQVKSITTDAPIHVALNNGHTISGVIQPAAGRLEVIDASGPFATETTAITALWREGDKTPSERAADALRRKWGYELAFDLNGRNGNTNRTFLGVSGRAVLEGAVDRLILSGNYSRAEENDAINQDEAKAGIDYSNFFAPKMSWYVRTVLGYDHIKDLDLRSQTAAGVGYTFIKKPDQKLEGRVGLSYRFENYGNAATPDFSAIGIDLGLIHSLDASWGRLTQTLSVTPSFEDLGNFVFVHDSALELPVSGKKLWKVRVGVRTDYNSKPQPGFDKMDWTYFSQLVLTWK